MSEPGVTCVKLKEGETDEYKVVKGAAIGANSGQEGKKSPELVKAEGALKDAQTALENAKDATDDVKSLLQQKVTEAQENLDRVVVSENTKKKSTGTAPGDGDGDGDGNDQDLDDGTGQVKGDEELVGEQGGGKSSNKNSKNSKGGALSFSELGSSPSATVPIKTHGGKSRKCKKGGKTRKNKKSTKKCSKKRCAKKCSKKRCAKKSSKK